MYRPIVLLVFGLLLGPGPLLAAEISVVDGDGVSIHGRKYRLHGVALPAEEAICTASDGRKWPCGRRAREQLAEAAKLDELRCQPADRETAICRVGGLDIGALLVKEGLAKAAGDYRDLEDRARAAKAGIWE